MMYVPGGVSDLIVLRPGLNLVDADKLAKLRTNSAFEMLFHTPILPSKAVEADPKTFGKPMLEIRGKELPDKAPLSSMPPAEQREVISTIGDTDLLAQLLGEATPSREPALVKAIGDRLKELAGELRGHQ